MTLRKILVPVDFSASADAALATAGELARRVDAELLLLHVQDEFPFAAPDGSGWVPPEVVKQVEETTDVLLSSKASKAREQGHRVRSERVFGSAHVQILRVAEREHVDMIVMGSNGRRGLGRVLLGSVAERVARTAKVPVMTVHSSPPPAGQS